MPYLFLPDGSIRVDSVDEAVALSLRLRQTTQPAAPAAPVAPVAPTAIPRTPWPLPTSEQSGDFALLPPATPASFPPVASAPASAERSLRRPSSDLAERGRAALRFLEAIQAAGPAGLGTSGMMSVFGVDQPRGLGSKALMMKNHLAHLGFEEGAVYSSARTLDQGTVFKAGPRLAEAISACSQDLAKATFG